MPENTYLFHINQNLPRLLGLFNQDNTNSTYGLGDRNYWAWGLIDFGNATFQGAANGFSLLWKSGFWPYPTAPNVFLRRIDGIFSGAGYLTRKDGSLEEAFPYEGSYCVTAVVAFDLLCALVSLKQDIDADTRTRWMGIIKPLIRFLIRADETHALISNHLATAVAALIRWHKLTMDKNAIEKAEVLLDRILQNQSPEGWFVEYQGADPGYQSLCTYYLADVHRNFPAWSLIDPLRKSVQFLWYFAHPDGSFGGLYGSRCTRFYNPAGIEALAGEIPEALALSNFMVSSIAENRVVTLSSIDEPNLVPWFNAYCLAGVLYEERIKEKKTDLIIPCKQSKSKRSRFDHAGIVIDQGPDYYTIINAHKGGVVVHFKGDRCIAEDAGVVARNRLGILISTQGYVADNKANLEKDSLTIESSFQKMPRRLSKPFDFLVLRLLCLTVFRSRYLREMVKQVLVRRLITSKKTVGGKNIRKLNFGPELSIHDRFTLPVGYHKIKNSGFFVAIHMASQGYWQTQDENKITNIS